MKRLFWTPEAIRDREDIYNYIEQDNPYAALSLDELIVEKVNVLKAHPKIGRPGRVVGTLELVIHSNYMVVYELDSSQVRILNVVHTARQWPPV